MTRLLAFLTAFWMTFGSAVHADQAVVVELFTSQGCSSCPPADKIFRELAERDDVVALSYHVDYWDYLGWKDAFASPEHTKYQRAYAHAAGERTIYTPQIVVGGQDLLIGSRPMKIANSLRRHAQKSQPVNVALSRSGDAVQVRATSKTPIRGRSVVYLITYLPKATVKVRRGENAGRTLAYTNIVQSRAPLGVWDGQGEFRASADIPRDIPIVVMVQAPKAGPILGAAQLR